MYLNRIIVGLIAAVFLWFVALPVEAQQEYVIGEGDLLRITVYDNPDLATEARISDGKIAFPLIGDVVISEMTVSEAEKKIASLLADGYLTKPHVAVFVLEFKKIVYVNGEVRSPGAYKHTKGLTVLKAITLAGGFTGKAADSRIKIIRKTEKGEINIKAKLDDLVEPDDIITVPESYF